MLGGRFNPDKPLQWAAESTTAGGGHDPVEGRDVSRGPTRRVRRLVDGGMVTDEVMAAADHEADLLGHPYIDEWHVDLARLRLAGLPLQRQLLLDRRDRKVSAGRWRPRGPRSALRARGVAQTRAARRRALAREAGESGSGSALPVVDGRGSGGVGRAWWVWAGAGGTVVWAGSWYLMILEITRWHHVRPNLRVAVIPGARPGMPLRLLYAAAIGTPIVVLFAGARSIPNRRPTPTAGHLAGPR